MDNIYQLVYGIMGIVTLILVIVVFLRTKPTVQQLDEKATTEVDARRNDRELIAFWEQAYQTTTAANRQVLDTTVGIIKLFAPMTSIKVDDSLLKLLEDIQTPDTVIEEPTAPQTAEELDARLNGAGAQG